LTDVSTHTHTRTHARTHAHILKRPHPEGHSRVTRSMLMIMMQSWIAMTEKWKYMIRIFLQNLCYRI